MRHAIEHGEVARLAEIVEIVARPARSPRHATPPGPKRTRQRALLDALPSIAVPRRSARIVVFDRSSVVLTEALRLKASKAHRRQGTKRSGCSLAW
jgi:hypothetical protein